MRITSDCDVSLHTATCNHRWLAVDCASERVARWKDMQADDPTKIPLKQFISSTLSSPIHTIQAFEGIENIYYEGLAAVRKAKGRIREVV